MTIRRSRRRERPRRALRGAILCGVVALAAGFAVQQSCRGQETRMTPELLWRLGRLGNATLSDDGRQIAFTVRRYDLRANSGTTSLLVKELPAGQPRELLSDWKSIADLQFAPSPFGPRLYFVGLPGKADDERSQVHALNPVDGGTYPVTSYTDDDFRESKDADDQADERKQGSGEDRRDSTGFGGVANLRVSPTGEHIAFTTRIKLDESVHDIYEDLPKADARIIDSLMFRHWNAWHDFKYSHLHVAAVGRDGRAARPVDFMRDRRADCPVPPFGGGEQIAWSPDGKEIAFTVKEATNFALSTDSNVHVADVSDPDKTTNVSDGMEGYDNDPVYSPDGKWLAFHSMERPGFESDRNRIMIRDRATGEIREATEGLDQTSHGARWTADSGGLVFASERLGTQQLFVVKRTGGGATQVSRGRFDWSLQGLFPDGKRALVAFSDMIRPHELAVMSLSDGATETVTGVNDDVYRHLETPTIEQRWVEATDGKKIHSWVILPPDFDQKKKWPLLVYCQGGPQGQVGQWFSYRWNFHLMAAGGYVVVAPNRRGLPGFGRQWNDQISGDWGGQAMRDILSVTDDMASRDYIDPRRVGAVGASFGGYTVYWLMGNAGDRFACMLAHCGVFNLESMYGSTEELFFVNWDLGGPYWQGEDVRRDYERFSPHRYVRNWKTPLLVVHGERDYRVPVTQGMEAFTAAQLRGVPSRFLYFPGEGHWVLQPQNGVLWQRVFFDWLDRHLGSPSTTARN